MIFFQKKDKNQQNKLENAQCFNEINQAYQVLSNADQRNLYNFLGADDYHLYKNQNSNFQNFFNSAFKIKTSFDKNEGSFLDQAKNRPEHCSNEFEKVFKEFFEEDSSSDEEEEETRNVFSFYNHFTMYCQKNKQSHYYHEQQFQAKFIQKRGQNIKEENFSSNFTGSCFKAKINSGIKKDFANKSKRILELIREKKSIFSIMRNQIRKKRKNNKCWMLFGRFFNFIYREIVNPETIFLLFLKFTL